MYKYCFFLISLDISCHGAVILSFWVADYYIIIYSAPYHYATLWNFNQIEISFAEKRLVQFVEFEISAEKIFSNKLIAHHSKVHRKWTKLD